MVRRLFVVLLAISCGFAACPASISAQETAPAKKAIPPKAEATVDPVQETDKKAEPAKVEVEKADVEKAEVEKAEVEKADVEKAEVANPELASENLLPASTKFWLSIPDADELEKQFDSTQFGQLAKDPAIKPFIDSLRDQAKSILNDQNVRLGLEVDDLHGVHSGEICIAGILPELDGQQQVKGAHGLVLLVDVTGNEDKAKELQDNINKELISRGAKQETKNINGVDVIKSTVLKQRPIRKSQSNFQVILNGRMLVCDNEQIFRGVLRRLATPAKIQRAETLGAQDSFQTIMAQTNLKEHASHIRWFIDPFGYIQLAQALEDEERGRQQHDDWAKILRDQGFSVFRGIGGNISVSTGEHEILHRTFTYAPRDLPIKNSDRVFNLFDFNGNAKTLEPADWVPTDSSAYITGVWNYSKALGSIGNLYDAFLEEEGNWNRTLNDFKVDPEMQLDIEKLVGLIDNRMTLVSAVERPIDESSERVVIGFPIKGEPDFIFDSLKRATRGTVLNLGGIKVLEVDSEAVDEDLDEFDSVFDFPGEEPEAQPEPKKRSFALFAKRYFVVHNGNLLVANSKDYLKKVLVQKESKLAKSADYIQVSDAIAKLTDNEAVRWRQFGRMDMTLEANYEMLRRGEMAKSQTVLARIANQLFAKQAADKAAAEGTKLEKGAVRKQKLDGSKLPEDYAKSIAPFFGPMGWVMEVDKDGWRITGCIVKKKGMTEVVQKRDEQEDVSQQR